MTSHENPLKRVGVLCANYFAPLHAKKLYLHMFHVHVDTAFSYERELTNCSFLQHVSKEKGNSLQLICGAHTAFLLCTAEFLITIELHFSVVYDKMTY